MSSAAGRPGRPPGADPETLERGRLFLVLADHGVAVSVIAARAGVAKSEVYRAMNLVRPLAPVEPSSQVAALPPAPPKRMSEGNLLRRAFAAIRNVRAFKGLLDAETREFWVEALIEIRALADDGIALTFGKPGDIYHSRDEFLSVFEGITPGQLEKLFRHAMLVDLDGCGVAMPFRWGFRDQAAAARQAKKVQRAQNPSLYDLVQGGLSDSGETPNSSGQRGGVFPDSDSGETRVSPDGAARVFPDATQFGRTAVADANAKEIHTLASVSATEGHARESGEIPLNSSGETRPDASGETLPESGENTPLTPISVADLTARMKALVTPGRPPHAKDLGAVQLMLDEGETEGTIQDAIEIKMKDWTGPPPNGLGYFVEPTREARARRSGASPSSRPKPVPAAAPEPPDEPILGTGTDAQWARVQRGIGKGIARNWLGKCEILGPDVDDELTVILPTLFIRDHVRQKYSDRLTALWQAENPAIKRVNLEVAGHGPPEASG
jgi:hypothetical protein